MLSGILWTYLFLIVGCTLIGGTLPLVRRERARGLEGFPKSEAFASGVFLVLSLMMMLPASFAAFAQAYPGIQYLVESLIAIAAFLTLLAI